MNDTLIERMTEIAHRDSAVSVTVRADDLRALLSKLRTPVADERAAIIKLIDDLQDRAKEAKRYDDFDELGLLRLMVWKASAPVAGEAQKPVRWLHTLHYETGDTSEIIDDSPDSPFGTPGVDYSDTYRVTSEPLYAAPQAGEALDAARYRWLREGDTDLLIPFHVDGCLPSGEQFDAAVDAVISAEAQQQGKA